MAVSSSDEIESRVKITEGSTPDLFKELSNIAQKSRSGRIRSLAEKGLLFERLLESGDLSSVLNLSRSSVSHADSLGIAISSNADHSITQDSSEGVEAKNQIEATYKSDETNQVESDQEDTNHSVSKVAAEPIPSMKISLGNLGSFKGS